MRVAIVGCTHAGTAVVTQIALTHPDTIVDVYERRGDISFLSCGISLYLEGVVKDPNTLFYASKASLEALGPNIHVHLRHDVLNVDSEHHTLAIQDLEAGNKYTTKYDKLVISTGSYPVIPPIQGISIPRVLMCKNYDDAFAIKETAANARRIAIVGGGYIGVELAEAYSRTGHDIVFINGVRRLLSHYVDEPISQQVEHELAAHGVDAHLHEMALRFDSDDQQVYVQTDKNEWTADLAVVCVGFQPMTELVEGQIELNHDGSIHVNAYMQSSNPDIYAAGDAAAVHFNPTGKDAYTPLATNAVRQGKLVGINLFGNKVRYMGTQATSALRLYDHTLACSGMTQERALQHGFDAAAADLTIDYRPNFMPTTAAISMRLVYNRANRRILGAQFYSTHDVSETANTISVMIQNRNTIDELAYVDMLFNPHYDHPWHYLNMLGQVAAAQADRDAAN